MRSTLVICIALLLAACTRANDGEALYLDSPYGWRLKIAAEPIPRMPELPVAASQVRTIADALRLLADQGAETVRFVLET